MGVPFIGVAETFYGCGFVSAYLSAPLMISASTTAVSVWRLDRVPATCLVGLLAASPAIGFVQVKAFAITFDPMAGTDADALTATSAVIQFPPPMMSSRIGAWSLVHRAPGRDTSLGNAPDP